MTDTRTLEQVIFDASSSYGMKSEHNTRSQAIAAAVREWMKEIAREPGHGPSGGVQGIQAARIKELEAEVARLAKPRLLLQGRQILRERFPYLPGDEFWTYLQGAIRKWSVCEVWIGGEEILCKGVANGKKSPVYRMHECHPTADACRAAIPVEEGEKN